MTEADLYNFQPHVSDSAGNLSVLLSNVPLETLITRLIYFSFPDASRRCKNDFHLKITQLFNEEIAKEASSFTEQIKTNEVISEGAVKLLDRVAAMGPRECMQKVKRFIFLGQHFANNLKVIF